MGNSLCSTHRICIGIHDLLLDVPDVDPYRKLKEQLIAQIADSEHQKL